MTKTQKQCASCKKYKDATLDNFYAFGQTQYFSKRCRECQQKINAIKAEVYKAKSIERQKEKAKATPSVQFSVKEEIRAERKPLKQQNELDRLFSLIIRTAHEKRCHNCGKCGEISDLQTGHWIGRTNFNTRLDLRNALPLCKTCNYFDHSHTETLTKRLIELYGIDIVDELNIKKIERFSPSVGQRQFLESMFKTLLKSLTEDTQRNIEKIIETQSIIDKLFLEVV